MIFKYIIITLIIVVGVQSCNPSDYRDPSNKCEWYISNFTGDSLLIKTTFSYFREPIILINDTTALVDNTGFSKHSNVFFQSIYDYNTIDDSIVISNMKGGILIVWKESQYREDGKQFFNERYWKKREWDEGNYLYHEWTFELLPEDIQN